MCWRWIVLCWSTASEALCIQLAMWLGVCIFCMILSSAPAMLFTYDTTRRVGSLACVASYAFLSQWWYVFAPLVVCAWAMSPLSVGSWRVYVMCYILICVAISFISMQPMPNSVVGLCIASAGHLGARPNAFLSTLLKSLYIVSSCLSVNFPRWLAWYLELSSWSITIFARLGNRRLFVRTLASIRTSTVMCLRLSRKSSMGLIYVPSIVYDLFGGGCRMGDPSFLIILCIFDFGGGRCFPCSQGLRSPIVLPRPHLLPFLVLVPCSYWIGGAFLFVCVVF